MSPDLILALMAGAVLGASAHRAGLCTVKAVAEVMTSGSGHVLWSFLKAALWTAGILSLARLAAYTPDLAARPLTPVAVLGGVVFGLGAAMNGACSFSTLARLAEGHTIMLFTLAGWTLGITGAASLLPDLHAPPVPTQFPGWLAVPLVAWMLWEGFRVIRRARAEGGPFLDAHWPLSFSVLLLGLANAALLLLERPWSFTATALCSAGAAPLAACKQPAGLWLVSLAALAAMGLSAWYRRSFRLRRVRPLPALRHLAAGTAMGVGSTLIPGGNDGLILFGIPSLSPHALPAWAGIVAGIWLALTAMRFLGRPIPRIVCEGDICRSGL